MSLTRPAQRVLSCNVQVRYNGVRMPRVLITNIEKRTDILVCFLFFIRSVFFSKTERIQCGDIHKKLSCYSADKIIG